MIQAYIEMWRRYFDFKGKTSRRSFWLASLANLLVSITLLLCSLLFGMDLFHNIADLHAIIMFIPSLSLSARRLHDIGKSGWWNLLFLTLIGSIWLIILWCQKSQPDDSDNKES